MYGRFAASYHQSQTQQGPGRGGGGTRPWDETFCLVEHQRDRALYAMHNVRPRPVRIARHIRLTMRSLLYNARILNRAGCIA